MSDFGKLANAVDKGDTAGALEITRQLLDSGCAPLDIVNKGFIEGMNIVGPKFKSGEMFIPEVIRSAKAMATGMELIKPLIAEADIPSFGTIVLGTVKGDLHDIGKNLVTMLLESGGFKIIDLGIDVSTEKFIEAIKVHNPQIVGMSAMLTTTLMEMKYLIDALKSAGLRDKVKVVVGGAPVSQEFADEIGADGYCSDAMVAKEMCKEIVIA